MARILMVEADDQLALILVRALRRDGHEVVLVSSGQHALTAMDGANLVILAIPLRDQEGINVLRAVRAEPALLQTPVLLLLGHAGAKELATGLDAGVDWYLCKPLRLSSILETVQHLLEEQHGVSVRRTNCRATGNDKASCALAM